MIYKYFLDYYQENVIPAFWELEKVLVLGCILHNFILYLSFIFAPRGICTLSNPPWRATEGGKPPYLTALCWFLDLLNRSQKALKIKLNLSFLVVVKEDFLFR